MKTYPYVLPSFPNFIWERACLRNFIARFPVCRGRKQQSCVRQVRSQMKFGNEGKIPLHMLSRNHEVSAKWNFARSKGRSQGKEPRSKLRGIFGWPGLLVARVRERGIASAQEVTGIWASPADLLFAWNVSTRTRTTSCPGHPRKTSRSKLRGISPKRLNLGTRDQE
jgi:hypothetical protein